MTTIFKNPHSKQSIKEGSGIGSIISSIPKAINFINDNRELITTAIDTGKKSKELVDNVLNAAKEMKKPKEVAIEPEVKIDENKVNNILKYNPEKKKGSGGFHKII